MHYTPQSSLAFASIEHIMRDVNYGWLLRYAHANGASMFFLALYIHMFRGMYYGSYKDPREVLWLLGVIIYLLAIATDFMGYVLPWGQMSYWAATVITNLFSAVPVFGQDLVTLLWGGFTVGNPTLNRFYALHYLLPFVIVAVVGLHLVALHQQRVSRLVYRLLGWRGEVEDIVQDVFLAALKSHKNFREESSQWTWLAAITINRCRTHRRRKLLEERL